MTLQACDLEDDRHLDFSRFRFLLGTRTPVPDGDLRVYQVEATAIAAHALLLRGNAKEGLLTCNVQRVLGRYSRRVDGSIWDEVSVAPVRFPDHLVEIRSRSASLAG